MSEETREVTIQVTHQEQMQIEAYVTPTPGLLVHRQVRWSPGKEEHKFTSKWQVCHEPSGRGLLTPSRCLPRQKDAVKLAHRLKGLEQWENVSADALGDNEELLQKVRGVYEGIMREQEDEESGEIVVDELYENRYYVERDRESRQYQVMDAKTGEVAADENGLLLTFAHRGKAWKEAHRLNNASPT